MKNNKLTHTDSKGKAQMVDVGEKALRNEQPLLRVRFFLDLEPSGL
jgi:molybdenum cofactor biosynthesis enzyme